MSVLFPLETQAESGCFSEREFAFAKAWELYAPGLGGWTVQRDMEDDGSHVILVDPPLVHGDGFELRKRAGLIAIRSSLGAHSAPDLRRALLLICPLGVDALAEADALAALPLIEPSRHDVDLV